QPNPLGGDRLGDSGGFRRRDRCSGPSADPDHREGSHQMTAQEISQFGRHGLHPIVLVLNNSGYLSERLLCKDMAWPTTTLRCETTPSFLTPWAARGGSMPV
ncbi:MAG: indolepyruvate decarboxylase, partial [Mycobacterium sp.]|nr:indolepyruvate decarboxylase [Mycobacterium sp.]